MIEDIIIENDPIIGTMSITNIPKGITYVNDIEQGTRTDYFLYRAREYIRLIQSNGKLFWPKDKSPYNMNNYTKFFISWKNNSLSKKCLLFGYRITLDSDGYIISERLTRKYQNEYRPLIHVYKGNIMLFKEFFTQDLNDDLLIKIKLPEKYKNPALTDIDPCTDLMDGLWKSNLVFPEATDLNFARKLGTEMIKLYEEFITTYSDLKIDWIYGDNLTGFRRDPNSLVGEIVDLRLTNPGYRFLRHTLPYYLYCLEHKDATVFDPRMSGELTGLSKEVESRLWEFLYRKLNKQKYDWENQIILFEQPNCNSKYMCKEKYLHSV